jgi:hypothetical protein
MRSGLLLLANGLESPVGRREGEGMDGGALYSIGDLARRTG